MNDRQIDSFLKIVNCGSFSKAAKNNYISVAAIIEQIDRLEEDLGFPLFERSAKGCKLTSNGEIFYKAFLDMKDIYDNALKQVKEGNNSINIGVASSQYPQVLMNACKQFLKKNKDISLHFIELPYKEHLEALRNKKIDLTIIAKPKENKLNNLNYQELCIDTCAFGMSDTNHLSKEKLITKKKLNNATILCGGYDYMETSFEEMLKDCSADLKTINSEYTLDIKANAKFNDSIIVFHKLWTDSYASFLKVIPSNINAGSVGILTRKDSTNNIKKLIKIINDCL